MGVFYYIRPFDEEMASLLEEMGAAVPDVDSPSRIPTPSELRKVCVKLRDFKVEFNIKPKSHWQVVIDGTKSDKGTILNIDNFNGAEDDPHEVIWFEKGSPSLILDIVRRVAEVCGPLVIWPDSDGPIAVTGKDSVKKLLNEWEHTQGRSD